MPETSLLGLLWSLDYDRVSVDLFLYAHTGELLPLLPDAVRLLPEQPAYRALCDPIPDCNPTGTPRSGRGAIARQAGHGGPEPEDALP